MEHSSKEDEEESYKNPPPPPPPPPPPHPLRDSAFSKPILSSSSSLLPPKGGGGGGGASRNGIGSSTGANSRRPHQPPSATDRLTIRYRECLRNHAATLGGHVVDGCCEFMSGADAMKCAACGCHRNFHRRDSATDPPSPGSINPNPNNGSTHRIPLLLPPPHLHRQNPPFPAPVFPPSPSAIVAFGGGNNSGGTTTESSSEKRNAGATAEVAGRKRFRTKFTAEQKERMMGFAERVGWRIQRQDEGEMQRFCSEIGVSRQVLKVWMHNNKHSVKKQKEEEEEEEEKKQKLQRVDGES